MTSGWQKSDLIIVAGRPSMGKTSFAMNMVEQATLHQERPVLVFSLEMPASQLITECCLQWERLIKLECVRVIFKKTIGLA